MPTEDEVWSQIDHDLVALELEQEFAGLVEQAEKEVEEAYKREKLASSSATFETEVATLLRQLLERWLHIVDRVYASVGRDQGKRESPELVRAVFQRAIKPLIDKPQNFEAELVKRIAQRTGLLADWVKLPWGFWLGDIVDIEIEWERQTEIRARRLQHRSRQRRLRARPEPRLKSRRGRKRGRPGLKETADLDNAVIEAREVLSRSLGRRPSTREIVKHFIQKSGVPLPNLWRKRDDIRDWRDVSRSPKYLRLAGKRFGRVPHKASSL